MKDKPENPPAFPLVYDGGQAASFCNDGMTLRDYFAAKYMQANSDNEDFQSYSHLAKFSYEMADAMLAERSKSDE